MRLFGIAKESRGDEESRILAEALYAGGDRADKAVDFIAGRLSETLRLGGVDAMECFCGWMETLMGGNRETARKFFANVLSVMPPDTRKEAMAWYGVDAGPADQELDPLLQTLAVKIEIGGKYGAEAVVTIFNAVEKVKGVGEAEKTLKGLLATLPPEARSSIVPYLPKHIRT